MSLIDSVTQERRYMIPAPYMYDALGNASFDAAYTLTQENGTYYLTVTADADWINAQGRQFPVTIDPTVQDVSVDMLSDTYIDSMTPTVNYGDSRALWARSNRISYFRCNTFSLPEHTTLDYAYLSVHYGYLNYVEDGYVRVGAYRVTMPWQESILTWSSASNYTTRGVDESVVHNWYDLHAGQGATLSSPDEQRFFITPVVQAWLDKECPNYGIALKFIDGTNKSVVFKSNETEVENRPKFHYRYHKTFEYINYYDLSFDSDRVNQISSAIQGVSNMFERQFGAEFEMYGSATHLNSLTDQCPMGTGSGCMYPECDYHHKDIRYISDSLYQHSRDSNQITVFWTDHGSGTYCEHYSDTTGGAPYCHYPLDAMAVVYKKRPVIHIMDLKTANGTSAEYQACMGLLLAHETAHTFGLGEAYTDSSHDTDGWACVMEKYEMEYESLIQFYNEISSKTKNAFCDSCSASLEAYMEKGLYGSYNNCD